MDPTYDYIVNQYAFSNEGYKRFKMRVDPIILQLQDDRTLDNGLELNLNTISSSESLPPIYCDEELYNRVADIKRQFNDERFQAARDEMNPFEKIGRSIFMGRASIKLANIDAIFNILGEKWSYLDRTSENTLHHASIAEGPGGFVEYIQKRLSNAQGYGFTLAEGLPWKEDRIDINRFIIDYGPDETGDLYKNLKHVISTINKTFPEKLDIVTADGGFDVESDDDSFLRQEFLSSKLQLAQATVGVICVKEGGNFILKEFDTVTKISADILYCIARSFDSITLFKPVSSRPANSERYLVCKGRNKDIFGAKVLYKASNLILHTNDYLSSIFTHSLPDSYNEWLYQSNINDITLQLYFSEQIILKMNDPEYINEDFEDVDTDKALIVWNLPDNTSIYKPQGYMKPGITRIKV